MFLRAAKTPAARPRWLGLALGGVSALVGLEVAMFIHLYSENSRDQPAFRSCRRCPEVEILRSDNLSILLCILKCMMTVLKCRPNTGGMMSVIVNTSPSVCT